MPTLSIYFIGTDHDKKEDCNILFLLHALTTAIDVPTGVNGNPHTIAPDNITSVDAATHAKILFDGVDTNPFTCHKQIISMAEACVRLCQTKAFQTVNMVGHSRGAINAIFLANRIAEERPKFEPLKAIKNMNLFLIDPVKNAVFLDDDKSVQIPNIVQECRQFLMEDDGSVFFSFEPIRRLPGGALPIETIFLPGTHGTATQCNRRIENKKRVEALKPLEIVRSDDIWPIGKVALSTILLQLLKWGTPLGALEAFELFFKLSIVSAYANILIEHKFNINSVDARPGLGLDGKRMGLNDLTRAQSGEKQVIKNIQGNRLVQFSNSGVPLNKFRGHNFFVNSHHADLFEELHFERGVAGGENIFMSQLKRATAPEFSMDLLVGLDAEQDADRISNVEKEIRRLQTTDVSAYRMLCMAGLKKRGQPLQLPS